MYQNHRKQEKEHSNADKYLKSVKFVLKRIPLS